MQHRQAPQPQPSGFSSEVGQCFSVSQSAENFSTYSTLWGFDFASVENVYAIINAEYLTVYHVRGVTLYGYEGSISTSLVGRVES